MACDVFGGRCRVDHFAHLWVRLAFAVPGEYRYQPAPVFCPSALARTAVGDLDIAASDRVWRRVAVAFSTRFESGHVRDRERTHGEAELGQRLVYVLRVGPSSSMNSHCRRYAA